MRVAVRPTHRPGSSGGVEQYVNGLAVGLSHLDGHDEFDFVGSNAHGAQLEPFLGGSATFVGLPPTVRSSGAGARFSQTSLGRTALELRYRVRRLSGHTISAAPDIVESDRYAAVHFPSQVGELTAHPNIYQPWDLQHLHYPQFFTREQLRVRDAVWGGCARRATYVLVASRFVRDDVVDAFGLDPTRVAVVAPGAPTTLLESERIEPVTGERPFALYPAQVWEHKNHVRLLDAVALLNGRGAPIRLVCPGQPNPRLRTVQRHAAELGVEHLVEFPGYLSDRELSALYHRARCLVFPSLFEGFGFPVLEAFVAGLPVACSSTSSLGELASGAAVLYDPTDVESIADGLAAVWTDDAGRADLAAQGRARAERYTWDHLARSCRALYRSAAGASLDGEDVALLAAAAAGA